MVDANCDIEGLMVDIEDMEYSIQFMEEIFIKYESQEEAQSDNINSSKSKFQDTKEQSQDSQNDLSKMVVRPWEEFSFNKNRWGLGYNK
jgi:hypothetical protein